MKSMVKVLALVMAACLVILAVVSCSGNDSKTTTEATTVETTTKEEVTTTVVTTEVTTTEVTTVTEKVTTTEETTTEKITTTEETTVEETTTEEETTAEETEPAQYWLTIQYIDNTDGSMVAPSYRMRYTEGTRVQIISPEVPGYEATMSIVMVIMDKNYNFRVYYNPVNP